MCVSVKEDPCLFNYNKMKEMDNCIPLVYFWYYTARCVLIPRATKCFCRFY